MATRIEDAVEHAIHAKLTASAVVTTHAAALRCFWLDTSATLDADPLSLLSVSIAASPAFPGDDRSGPCWTVPVEIVCTTAHEDDRKRQTLLALYGAVRTAIEAESWTVPTGYAIDAVIVEGGTTDPASSHQSVSIDLRVHARDNA